MTEKAYDWIGGARLEEHSRRKHKILREYFAHYLRVRCQLPQQERFRLAVVDGFAGAGRYDDGTAGSPLIFLEGLRDAVAAVDQQRAAQGFAPMAVECLLIFNDHSPDAIDRLRGHVAPLQAAIAETRATSPTTAASRVTEPKRPGSHPASRRIFSLDLDEPRHLSVSGLFFWRVRG